jgi:protein arginine N-methyltransferase 5
MDNLESQIYEIFEKDPCKYKSYKDAVKQALIDRVKDDEKFIKESIIMILGAGRGPLVNAVLEAAAETQRKAKVYALEKNVNAVNT